MRSSTVTQPTQEIFTGLGLMGVVAPLSACLYMLCDRVNYVQGWYHVNYFHFFYLLGPYFFQLFCLLGTFLLFPQGSKRSFLIAVPTGYILAKIVWLATVTTNQELWQIVPSALVLIAILTALVLFLTIDYLTWRQFHRVDAFERRLETIDQATDKFPAEKVVSMFKQVMQEKKDFQKQY
jgi:hypothetical protein